MRGLIELRTVALVLCFVTWAIQIYRDECDGTNNLLTFIALGIWVRRGNPMVDVFILCSSYVLGINLLRSGTYGGRHLWLLLICLGVWLK